MGILSAIKNKLGIGGVKVKLQVPGQVTKDSKEIVGKFTLTTKSEQEIVDTEVKLMEEFTTGRGDNAKTTNYELGIVKFTDIYRVR